MSKRVYFDYSATTPVSAEVLKVMEPYWSQTFGNPSSIHSFGQEARAGVEKARDQVAEFLGCQSKEIIFTSGATEANNLGLRGLMKAVKDRGNTNFITTKIEHHCVGCVALVLAKVGVTVDFVGVDKSGVVKVEDIQKAIKPETALISVMYVNNEVGTIQPIKEIGQMIKEENKKRDEKHRIYFHVDAVQAANYLPCQVDDLGVDLLALSAHKIYGPKGAGALYIRQGTPMKAIQFGGDHEYKLRAGTLNATGIVGLGAAVELLKNNEEENKRIKALRDKLIAGVREKIPDVIINGDLAKRVPSNAHLSFKGAEGESLLMMLDMEGIAVSTGSACSASSLEPSHVIKAMGLGEEISHSSLRITLGKYTTEEEIDYFLEKLPPIVEKLRKMSPIK
ncbi:MAG: cysteine desulfurase family protein [bacterium]